MKIKSLLLAFAFAFATTAFAETVTILTENFNGLSTGRTTQVTPDKLPNLLSAASYVYGETQDYSKVAYPTRGVGTIPILITSTPCSMSPAVMACSNILLVVLVS